MYKRYDIDKKTTPNIAPYPQHFRVKVKRFQLLKLLIKEWFRYRNWEVVKSRPCVYGVFSGPIGGFAPREKLCVGCLRCTTQYPKVVTILKNNKRDKLGDSYFTSEKVSTVTYEAERGRIPVKGAGYKGPFGGEGFDGMWTDMSEIIRPTRDGIHGREFISTEVDLGEKLPFLEFEGTTHPKTVTLPIPFLFDTLPNINPNLSSILEQAANELEILSIQPIDLLLKEKKNKACIPLVQPDVVNHLKRLHFKPSLIELSSWNEESFQQIKAEFPKSLFILRCGFEEDLLAYFFKGVRLFHICANYHGRGKDQTFLIDLIRKAHLLFVKLGVRDKVTLIGSGGIVAAEHVPKAILCGLDCVALDTPLLAALQGRFHGECAKREKSHFTLPQNIPEEWAVQRLKNLVGSWQGQLLEILGAMGLREVRRLRGEMGRALFQKDLENEAFSGIPGYEKR